MDYDILDHHRMLTMNTRIDIDAEYGAVFVQREVFLTNHKFLLLSRNHGYEIPPCFFSVIAYANNTCMLYYSLCILPFMSIFETFIKKYER